MMSDMTDEGMRGRRVVPVSFVDVAVLGPVLFPWGSRRWRSRVCPIATDEGLPTGDPLLAWRGGASTLPGCAIGRSVVGVPDSALGV